MSYQLKLDYCNILNIFFTVNGNKLLEKLEGLSRAHTSPTDLDLPKFNHLVPCGQGYDWPSVVTIGLELVPGSCSQTYLYIHTYLYIYLYIYRHGRKHSLPSPSVGEVITACQMHSHHVLMILLQPTSFDILQLWQIHNSDSTDSSCTWIFHTSYINCCRYYQFDALIHDSKKASSTHLIWS